MSYLERSRELATLKVLGFQDRHIGRLLTMATEYELKLPVGIFTYVISVLLTFGTSLCPSRTLLS